MNQENQISEQVDDEIDLWQLWQTLVDGKWIIAAFAVVSFVGATALAYVMTPKYQAEVLVAPIQDSKSGGGVSALAAQYGGLAEMAGINIGGGGGSKEVNLAYLKSRAFIEAFIIDNNLMPVLYAGAWDETAKKWKSDDPSKIPSMWDAYNFFSKVIVSVNSDKKTGLTTVSVLWKDREQAVAWANGLIEKANQNLRQAAIEEAQKSIGYLEQELKKTSVVEVQQSIYRVMESQVKTMMMANVQEQYAFKVIDPAAMMDEDAYVKPKRALMMVLGVVVGLFLGVLAVFIRKVIRDRKCSH